MYLSIKNISKNYGAVNILKSISLEVEANSTISILGKSGCGKSTLLKIIAGLEKENSGNIFLNDIDITQL